MPEHSRLFEAVFLIVPVIKLHAGEGQFADYVCPAVEKSPRLPFPFGSLAPNQNGTTLLAA